MDNSVPFAGGWEAHRHRHCIWIVVPDDLGYERAFNEVAEVLQAAFRELGGSAPIVTKPEEWNGRVPIVLGGNVLWRLGYPSMPAESIILNLEQMTPGSVWVNERYLPVLRSFPVLDFSQSNLAALHRLGITHARLLGVGYSPQLSRITPAPEQDIDVFFYGSFNERRMTILQRLADCGLSVIATDKAYGPERDEVIARAKIVLNVHYLEGNAFEIVRVSYLLANRTCVVSEYSGNDPDVAHIRDGVEFAPYEELVSRCVALVGDPVRRAELAETGFRRISSRRQSDLLKSCVEENASYGAVKASRQS